MSESACYVDNCDLSYCSGDGCIKCKDGYYLSGTSCYQCQSTCTKCLSYSTCTECAKGWHGPTCSSQCKSECLECSSFSQCKECIPGRYGSYCQNYCPLACIDIVCEIDSGNCLLGCRHGYYLSGETCAECPENCVRCFNTSHCSECAVGYFGTYCQSSCSQGCKNNLCAKDTGTCIDGCEPGYFNDGELCLRCPYRCASCNDENTCINCKSGYWGLQCQNDCPTECLSCDTEGRCIEGKVKHF